MSNKNLVVDLTNLAFITRFSMLKTPKRPSDKDPYASQGIFVESVKCIAREAIKNRCNGIVVCADSKNVWRRDIYPNYKNKDKTEDLYHDDVIEACGMLERFFTEVTNSLLLKVDRCEGDDLIAVWANSCDDGVANVILSSDRDFVQLVDDDTSLYSVSQKEFREADDPKFELFVKCIRGDTNDVIPSAYPRVRETVLKTAWDDDVAMMNLMEHILPDGTRVGDNLIRNMKLISLAEIPPVYTSAIRDQIFEAMCDETHVGGYNSICLANFLSEHGVGKSLTELDKYSSVFRMKPQLLKD